jgi:hypothetical protein
MNLKEVKKIVFSQLENSLASKDFKLYKAKESIRKKEIYGFSEVTIIIELNEDKSSINLELILCVKLNVVENIKSLFFESNPKFKNDRSTHCDSYDQLHSFPESGFLIKNIEDLNRVITTLISFIDQEGLSFFAKYSNINNLDYLYNNQKDCFQIASKAFIPRLFNSIILAKLNNRPDFEDIVRNFEKECQDNLDSGMVQMYYPHKFNALVSFLRHYPIGVYVPYLNSW